MIHHVLNDESMSQTAVFKWHKIFKDGRGNMEEKYLAVRPSTSRTDDEVQSLREVMNLDN